MKQLSLHKQSTITHPCYETVKERRHIIGTMQEDMAAMAGVSSRTLKAIETGKGIRPCAPPKPCRSIGHGSTAWAKADKYMRKAQVYYNKELAGTLTELSPKEYVFRYEEPYFTSQEFPFVPEQ
jgi:DNA-binding XRE family transcriptional regulator